MACAYMQASEETLALFFDTVPKVTMWNNFIEPLNCTNQMRIIRYGADFVNNLPYYIL
jgi:hypothetical protein